MAVAVVTPVVGSQGATSSDDDSGHERGTNGAGYESALDGDEDQLQSQHLGDGHEEDVSMVQRT